MKILMIVFNQVGRGTYWRAFNFAKNLAANGHDVSLIATSKHALRQISCKTIFGFTLVETPDLLPGMLRSGWDIWSTLSRILWIGKKHFDIVHAFESRPVVIYPALIARQNGAKLIIDWCDYFGKGGSVEERSNTVLRTILRPVETYFENHFRTIADGSTVINSFLYIKATNLGVKPSTIEIIKNGCNIQYKPIDKKEARVGLGIPPETPIIGYLGSLFQKDALFMAKAFNILLDLMPDIKLLLIGNFNRQINHLITKPASLIFTDFVESEQVYRYLSACDICWVPLMTTGANRGRFPMKINDYMTAGRPIIATDLEYVRDLFNEHNFGLICRSEPEEFADNSRQLILDKGRNHLLGKTAREVAETVYNWTIIASQLELYYKSIL